MHTHILSFRRDGPLARVSSLVAAVALVVIVGGLIAGLIVVRGHGSNQTGGSPTPTTHVSTNLYLGSGTGVYKIDTSTGKVVWSYPLPGSYSAPTVVNGVVYAASLSGPVVALDANTGKQIWSHDRQGIGTTATPAVVGGVVYVGGSDAGQVLALNASDGTQRWVAQIVPTDDRNSALMNSVIVADGVVYGNVQPMSGQDMLFALNASDGTQRWKTPAPSGQRLVDAPVLADGILYVATTFHGHLQPGQTIQSYVFAIKTDGKQLWRSDALGGGVLYRPAVAQGVIYVNSLNGMASALDANTGKTLWQSALGQELTNAPQVIDGALYLSNTIDGDPNHIAILAVDVSNHSVRWQRKLDALYGGRGLLAIKDVVYTTTSQGIVYALRTSDGSVLWQTSFEGANQSPGGSGLTGAP